MLERQWNYLRVEVKGSKILNTIEKNLIKFTSKRILLEFFLFYFIKNYKFNCLIKQFVLIIKILFFYVNNY